MPIFISVGKSREKVVEQWDPNIWLAAFSVRLVKYAKPFTRRPIFHYSFTRGHAPIKEKHCSFSWKFLTCPPNNWVINIANLQFSIRIHQYRHWTHVRTYGTDVFAVDMLSSISQAGGNKLMKPIAFYCVFILVLRRFLPDF